MNQPRIPQSLAARGRSFLARFAREARGNIAIMAALTVPVVAGGFGLGSEVVSWYATERSLQAAADSAAIAAATNSGADFDVEAKAVALKYGYSHGVKNVTVAALASQACPSGGSNCYKVTITKTVPVLLAQMVAYRGDTTLGGSAAKRITASAVSVQANAPREYCVVALASSGYSPGIRTNGGPKADMRGCSVMSNTSATCNGHNLDADNGDAHGTNDGCGNVQHSQVPEIGDRYAALASNIPRDDCGNFYPKAPQKKNDSQLPEENILSGFYVWGSNKSVCGDVQLEADTQIQSDTNGAVLYLRNGKLDLNGFKLSTVNGSYLTIVFTGTAGAYEHMPTGGGMLDITAPTRGKWSGVSIYQDPALTQGVDISDAGNSPTWNITGLVYLPHANVKFSGAVNKSSNGFSCFVLVVDNLLINGTGSILARDQCRQAGLTMPTNPVLSRGKLVS